MKHVRSIDLFARCGGLSEGFIQAGYIPVTHVEMKKSSWSAQALQGFPKRHDSVIPFDMDPSSGKAPEALAVQTKTKKCGMK